MSGLGKTLIDSERVTIDGRDAFRLFFYDEQEGYIIKAISFIAEDDIILTKVTPEQIEEPIVTLDPNVPTEPTPTNIDELQEQSQNTEEINNAQQL